jgi:hypothetical protein
MVMVTPVMVIIAAYKEEVEVSWKPKVAEPWNILLLLLLLSDCPMQGTVFTFAFTPPMHILLSVASTWGV